MKRYIVLISVVLISHKAIAQRNDGDSVIIDGTEYIPIEGRGETPNGIAGNWILRSGLKKRNLSDSLYSKKPAQGEETGRKSKTRVKINNGVTTTTTETEITRIATSKKRITPKQGGKFHHPDRPSLSFYAENQTFSGFTGCNKFSGRYTASGNKISLKPAAPSTKMVCIGEYDEKEFLSKLKRVNAFKSSNGRLQLLRGNDVLLVFGKK